MVNAAHAKVGGLHARASNEGQYWGASSCCAGTLQPLKDFRESKFDEI
jgi:hypothetical protein